MKQKIKQRTGNRKRETANTVRAAALGLSLLIAPAMGCTYDESAATTKKPAATNAKKPAVEKKSGNGLPEACDIEITRDEIRQIEAGFVRKCRTNETDILTRGQVVSTKTGKHAKIFRIDEQGAFIAFGANGSYSAGAYIPYGTTLNIFDPELLEGKESEKVRELNEDVWMLICPAKNQPAAQLGMSMMRVVKRTWGELKCLIADLRKGPEEKARQKAEAKKRFEQLMDEQERVRKQMEAVQRELKKLEGMDSSGVKKLRKAVPAPVKKPVKKKAPEIKVPDQKEMSGADRLG